MAIDEAVQYAQILVALPAAPPLSPAASTYQPVIFGTESFVVSSEGLTEAYIV